MITEKARRPDLIEDGCDVNDAVLLRSSRLLAEDYDNAVYHAIFDKSAPHAVSINPPASRIRKARAAASCHWWMAARVAFMVGVLFILILMLVNRE